MTLPRWCWPAVVVVLQAVTLGAQEHEHGAGGTEKLGTVSFETSCTAQAQPLLQPRRGAAALLRVLARYRRVQRRARRRPVLRDRRLGHRAQPVVQFLRARRSPRRGAAPGPGRRGACEGHRAEDAARDCVRRGGLTAVRERRDLGSAGAAAGVSRSDGGARGGVPGDSEASIFYALALAAAASPADKTYADLLKAGGILEKLFATAPDHPGLAHYIIHSYDVPALAGHALAAARRYAIIAPASPHALHMPAHTFTRLGLWQESIDSNTAAAVVARREGVTAEELHSMDYRAYAYLQTGQDAAARQLLDALPEVRARFDPNAIGSGAPGSAGVFALAAIPARYALERGAWSDAAKLLAQASRYLYPEAMTYYAKAIGAARIGDRPTRTAAIEALRAIRDRAVAAQEEPYWAGQVAIQLRSASAWLALCRGTAAEALAEMRAAAEMEDATEKSAVTPGPLAPARELVGEMLLQMKEPAGALKEFDATLEHEPNRFRALSGAARSALLAGDREKARAYYATLLEVCERADTPGRADLVEARRVVSATP